MGYSFMIIFYYISKYQSVIGRSYTYIMRWFVMQTLNGLLLPPDHRELTLKMRRNIDA